MVTCENSVSSLESVHEPLGRLDYFTRFVSVHRYRLASVGQMPTMTPRRALHGKNVGPDHNLITCTVDGSVGDCGYEGTRERPVLREDSKHVGLQELPFEEISVWIHRGSLAKTVVLRRVSGE